MTPIIALLLAVTATEPQVTGLSVSPVAGRTEVVILVDGSVTSNAFMLDDGRLVLDLSGLGQTPRLDIPDFNRGGIRELRMAPFQPNVGRLVLALSQRIEYEVSREDGRIRVSFVNPAGAFEPWTHAMSGSAPAATALPAAVTGSFNGSPATAARPAAAPQQPRSQMQEIRITFFNEPIASVLAQFSEYADRTIMASPSIQDVTVSAELRGLSWRDALEAILDSYNLIMRESPSGVLVVETAGSIAQRREMEPVVTRSFPVQFIAADSIKPALDGLITEVGSVTVNRSSNTLLVTDVQSAVDRVAAILPELDAQVLQVDISAQIAFIDRTALEAMGVVYDLKDSRGSQFNRLTSGAADLDNDGIAEPVSEDIVLLGGSSVAALGNANNRVTGPALELVSTLVLGRHSLISFIEALQTVSLSDIQAKPHVTVMNHRRATIQVGEETPIRVIDAGAGGAAAGAQAPRATVQMQQTGVILEVTPHITGNQVLLEMRAERSNVAAAATSDVGLIFQTQNAETHVLVNDGETVVIGGLTVIEKTRSRAGIPLLMDLPVIGALFRNETERENKRDLLILVTPHIVRH